MVWWIIGAVKLTASIGRHAGDLLAYIVLPLFCVALPLSWGDRLIRHVANRGWLLESRSRSALQSARRYLTISDPNDWRTRWRWVELVEARNLWYSLLGRTSAVLGSVRVQGMPAPTDNLVLIGMHWGPSLLALGLFREAGLGPRFCYRQVDGEVRRVAPFLYVYLRLLVRYIRRTCEGRDVPVPGARKKLQSALHESGTPILLLDAPIARNGRSLPGEVLGIAAEFSREGAEVLATGGASCVLYALALENDGRYVLRCGPPFKPESAEDLIAAFSRFLSEYLEYDSAQWRLWHAAEQLFRPAGTDVESSVTAR